MCLSIAPTAPAPTANGATRSSRVTLMSTLMALRRTCERLDCIDCTSVGSRARSCPSNDARFPLICSSCSSADSLSSTLPLDAIPSSIGTPPSSTNRCPPPSPSRSTLTSTCIARCLASVSACDLLALTSADSTPLCRKRCRTGSSSHSVESACIADTAPGSESIATRRRTVVSSTCTLAESMAFARLPRAKAAAAAAFSSRRPTTLVSACAPPARWKERAWLRSVTRSATAVHTESLTVAGELGLKSSSTIMASPLLCVMICQKRSSPHTPPMATAALARRVVFCEEESMRSSPCTESCRSSSSRQRRSEHSSEMISADISAVRSSLDARCPTSAGSTSDLSRRSRDRGSEDLARQTRQRRAEREMLWSLLPACLSTATSPRASAITSHTS
mmetsp:Transcript_52497/g.107036  ORF Transcript_52497/g.107036 Transcript_52497/m.107036 type:complete len:392 (-) Transcript_52497:1978-3153(-)